MLQSTMDGSEFRERLRVEDRVGRVRVLRFSSLH